MFRVANVVMLAAALLAPCLALADFPDLAKRVPSDANAIVLIDMDKILASGAAAAGGWKEKIENAFTEGITILPPSAKRAILASRLDLEFMSTIWQVELLES